MIRISFLSGERILAMFWILLRLTACLRQRRVDWKRELLLLLWYVNLAVLLRIVFFPRELDGGRVQPLLFDPSSLFPLRINWIPFKNLLDYDSRRDLLLNVIGNAAVFIPTGILLPVLFPRCGSFRKTLLYGALLSLCIELLQLPFSVRATDIDDLLLNVLGAAVGYGLFALARGRKSVRKG